MRKLVRRLFLCSLIAACFWTGSLIADRQMLQSKLIRLHVVGASNSEEDQAVKLKVKDAVVEYLNTAMADIADVEKAKVYVSENLPNIQKVANDALVSLGEEPTAVATFCKEEFGRRVYETFTLPSGVYDALRITLGEGEGRNWWCVVFPTLCAGATTQELEAVATGAGFSDSLTGAIAQKDGYEVRFFFLDMLGKLENILRS